VDDDGEYEIVPADECDDGEWMDDKLEQLKETTKPMVRLNSSPNKPF
jgi:hypothetical protein